MIGPAHRWETLSAWVVVVVYASTIFYLSSQPQPLRFPFPVFQGLDKVVHAFEYGLLSLLLYWAIGGSFRTLSRRLNGLISIGIAASYGLSDEFHQTFVPMRHADPFDVFADAVGACCALMVLRAIYRSKRRVSLEFTSKERR